MMPLDQLPVIESLLVLSIIAFFFFYKQTRPARANSIPSPPKLPILGNLHQLGSLPHRSLHSLSLKHGPIMLLQLGRVPTLILSSPDTAHEVLKVRDLSFASRPPYTVTKRLFYNWQDVAFTPYGEYWRQVRRISVFHLLSLNRVQSFAKVRQDEVLLMVEKIRTGPQPVNLSETILALTNDYISRVVFGRKHSCSTSSGQARAVLDDFLVILGEFSVGDFVPWLSWLDKLSGLDARMSNMFTQLDAFLVEVIEDHLQKKEVTEEETMDFADVLLFLEAKPDGISLTRDNIKAILLDMYAGGTHTAFTSLEWMMAELIRNPETMKRVQEEVRGVVGLKRSIEEENLAQMNYIKLVMKESLRLHPPIPLLFRQGPMEDIQLMGYHIPSTTQVMINSWSIGRDPRSWERAEEFWPDRFMDSSVDFRGQNLQFLPFGSGRRGCPGVDFAVSIMELVLANLLFHFDWKLPDGKEAGILDMSETAGLTARKKYGLVLEAKTMFY